MDSLSFNVLVENDRLITIVVQDIIQWYTQRRASLPSLGVGMSRLRHINKRALRHRPLAPNSQNPNTRPIVIVRAARLEWIGSNTSCSVYRYITYMAISGEKCQTNDYSLIIKIRCSISMTYNTLLMTVFKRQVFIEVLLLLTTISHNLFIC